MATTASIDVSRLMLTWGSGLVGTQSRGEWKRIWLWCCFCLPYHHRVCLFDVTLTPTIYATETRNLCDHGEIKRGFLLTLGLTTSLSSYFFLPHHELLFSDSDIHYKHLPCLSSSLCVLSLISRLSRQIHPVRPGKKAARVDDK